MNVADGSQIKVVNDWLMETAYQKKKYECGYKCKAHKT